MHILQKPGLLTTFRRQDYEFYKWLNNKYLTPALGGQYCPANYGQAHWFFHLGKEIKQMNKSTTLLKCLDALGITASELFEGVD